MTQCIQKPTAVVVNDDPIQLCILSRLLAEAGISVHTFESAEAALAAMALEDPPDLVITDLYMPGIDGWRFCRLLRSPEYRSFNDVPILVVSATFAGDHPEGIAADIGADAFLFFPVDGEVFVAQALALLQGENARRLPRALIVDDSKPLANLLKRTFAAHGYQADVALTAGEGRAAFSKARYDIAVLDYLLPDGTGDALLDVFQAERPDCVYLMITGNPTPELALSWMKRGAAAYLRKPFDPEYLIELCARARRERTLLHAEELLEVRTQELRENEEEYRSLFDQSADGIYVHDLKGRMLDVNKMACEQSGYSREEWLGLTVFDGQPSRSTANSTRVEILRTWSRWLPGHRFVVEAEHQRKDGTVYPVEISTGLVHYGGTNALLAIVRDITDRKKAEEELVRSRNRELKRNEFLSKLTRGADLKSMLDELVLFSEEADPSIRASLLLYDEERGCLVHATAPSLPDEYNELMRPGLPIGPDVMSCPSAAFSKQRVIVTDIQNSRRWLPHETFVKQAGKHNLKACWSQPILAADGRLLGTIANYAGRVGEPSPENLEILEMMANVAALAIEKTEAEERLRFDNLFRGLVAEVSARFVQVSDRRSFDEAVNRALASIGLLFGVDRSYLFRFSKDLSTMDNTHEWCAQGITAQKDRIQQFSLDRLPWWKARIFELHPLHVPEVVALPSEAEAEREEFQAQGIHSLISLPICDDRQKLIGFLGFDAVRTPHVWPEEHLAMLQVLAQIIGNAVVRLEATRSLAESEAYNRTIIQAIPDILIQVSAKGEYLDIDAVSEGKLFVPKRELLGKSIADILPEDTTQRILAAIGEAFETKNHALVEYELTIPAGVLSFEARIIPLDEERALALIRDITDRKHSEEEREKLQGQLVQAQKMESIGMLAGGVAHDFNNMLGVILGHAELAMNRLGPDDPVHEDMEEIRKAARRSAGLTRQLLAFARKQTVAPKVLDFNAALKAMLTMLKRLIGEDIDLVWKPGRNIWPVKIDPTQLDQILANLCVNSRDAIAGVGVITIETRNTAFGEDYCASHAGFVPGDYVMLAVSDSGCGMDEQTLSRLFEPFFTTKEMGKGSGLGLPGVYGAMKQNNGFTNVYSEPGQGTTFKIYLPRHADQSTQEEEERRPQPAPGGGETILLVEDEPAILKMTTTMLERLGYSVLTASTPLEALSLAGEHSGGIDLLMTDVVMPQMNGRDLAEKLPAIHPKIKRLFMSGYTADVVIHRGLLDEEVHFIQKPFSMEELAARLQEVFSS